MWVFLVFGWVFLVCFAFVGFVFCVFVCFVCFSSFGRHRIWTISGLCMGPCSLLILPKRRRCKMLHNSFNWHKHCVTTWREPRRRRTEKKWSQRNGPPSIEDTGISILGRSSRGDILIWIIANDLFKTIDILFLFSRCFVFTNQLLIMNFAWRLPLKMECWSKIRDVNNGYLMLTILTAPVVTLLMKHRFSAQLRNPILRDSVLTSLRFLVTALGRYRNNVLLVEKFEIMFSPQQQPIAIYAHLALPQWRADNFDIFQYSGFGHNTSVLEMAPGVREGVVRPSSCNVRSPDWLTPNTFYSRGVLFNDDPSFSRKHVLKILEQASLNAARPIYIVGRAFARQAHIRPPTGWEWLLSFRRFLPDVTIHAMIKKMSVLPLIQEPLRTILPRQQRQLWLGTRLHLRLQHVWNLQSSPLFNKLIPGD